MSLLKEAGFHAISLREIIEHINSGRAFPGKSFAITFDDGFKNVYSHAFPVLKEFGFIATVFLVTGNCGKSNHWDIHLRNIPSLDLLCWDEIVEMSRNGFDFGAHTLSHTDLSGLSIRQATQEIVNSKAIIQDRLGKDILFFTYPYGIQTEEIRNIVKSEFSGACSDKMGFTTLGSDIYSLPRIEMYYFSKNDFLTWLDTSLFSSYIHLRSIFRLFNLGNR